MERLVALVKADGEWQLRRALRWGSEYLGAFADLETVKALAEEDIRIHGDVGKITFIDYGDAVLYYTVHEEDC
jgi:hypothetical protein